MKKLILSSAAILMAFSFSAIAGTPENNKSEAKAKVTYVYHYESEDLEGNITFASGPANGCPNGTAKPCEWESDQPMDTNTPLKKEQIQLLADVTQTRS